MLIEDFEVGTWVAVVLKDGTHAVGIVVNAKRGMGVKYMKEEDWGAFSLFEELKAMAPILIDWDAAS